MSLKRTPGDDSGDHCLSITLFSIPLHSEIQRGPAYAASLMDGLFGLDLKGFLLRKKGMNVSNSNNGSPMMWLPESGECHWALLTFATEPKRAPTAAKLLRRYVR